MNLGMIGALGGMGNSMIGQSQFLAKQEEAEADSKRRIGLEAKLAELRDQYAQKSEERADVREQAREGRGEQRREREKDSDFNRFKREAPERTAVEVESGKAKKRGESEVAEETVERDARVKKTLTNAGVSDADVRLKESQARENEDRGAYYRGGAGAGAKAAGESPQLKAVREERATLQKEIDKAKLSKTFDAADPEHQNLTKRLQALSIRERALSGGLDTDPQGMRGSPPPAAGSRTPDRAPTGPGQWTVDLKAQEADQLRIMEEELRQPEKRPGDHAAIRRDMERLRASNASAGAAPTPAPAAPATTGTMASPPKKPVVLAPIVPAADARRRLPGDPPAAQATTTAPAPAGSPQAALQNLTAGANPAGPTEALGRELDAARSEYKDRTAPEKRPGLKAGTAAREKYATEIQALRDKIRGLESRYADTVGAEGRAAFAYR